MPEQLSPFKLPSTTDWQERFVEAALATPGVNVPRAALEAIAPFVHQPKDLITRASENRPAQLRSVWTVKTSAGEMLTTPVHVVGCAGSVWERNERQSTAWQSPSDPINGINPVLPPLSPWTARGNPNQVGAALLAEVETLTDLRDLIDRAVNELGARDGDRPYDLTEDLALNGQLDPCLLAPQEYRLSAPVDNKRPYWAWVAVRGNNRTKARQTLWGLKSSEVVTGVPMSKLGRHGPEVATNPSYWIKTLGEMLNEDYRQAAANEDSTSSAYRAHKVAVVETHLVIGTPTPERLYQIVQTSNRRDHVHPPLGFKPNDRARAMGRSILGAYLEEGLIDKVTADVLTGDLSIHALPGVPEGAAVSALRDIRSMRLLTEFFPTEAEKEKRRAIRAALSESTPSQLSRSQVDQRLRAWSALTSMSYPDPWNPRVADGFPIALGKEGIRLSGRSLPDLLASADRDAEAFEELLMYRAPHWLAAYDIVEADRGSMGAQKLRNAARQDQEDEQVNLQIRRSVTNAIKAMRADPTRAVGLLREIANAMDEGRSPRRIEADGGVRPPDEEGKQRADREWFNTVFPKITPSRGRIVMPTGAAPDAATPPPESDTDAVKRLSDELEIVVGNLYEDVKLIPELVQQIREHAGHAGIGKPMTEADAAPHIIKLVSTVMSLREAPDLVMSLTQDMR
ncbi:hypothetical protein [Herbidospora cretacea]|uniref:hypothetical protein n=1 Tax=Herbidospora cretacea TaxID=28444 RepID=UPI0012DC8915|nr:hypothetical protein [Herbidospora cretacea]